MVFAARNPGDVARSAQTMVLRISEIRRRAPDLEPGRMVVVDGEGNSVLSQLVDTDGNEVPDELVFQTDFGPHQVRSFGIAAGERPTPTRDQFRVYGRFVRERQDDFAWENDRIAHRVYGPALETWAKEPLTSSGVDVWCKRVRRLVVNEWYMTDDYHQDHGDGADLYSVGKSRGCGGIGIWKDDKLYVSRNFTSSRVLANGPIRLVFELGYSPFAAGSGRVSETKRVTLDAGKNFNRFESTFAYEGKDAGPLIAAVGIAKHPGGAATFDKATGILRTWEPLKEPNGHLGCAVMTGSGVAQEEHSSDTDHLLTSGPLAGGKITYYAGFGWDKSGDFADETAWAYHVQAFADEVATPVVVELGPAPPSSASEQNQPTFVRACESIMQLEPRGYGSKWAYDNGLVLQGFLAVFRKTGNRRYLDYVKRSVDRFIDKEGNIEGYVASHHNLDDINMGKVLFPLLAEAKDEADRARYRKALELLRQQIRQQPRTADGAYWHKDIYPHQMWLDGVYMASPFLAEYAAVLHEPALFDDVVKQVLLAEKHMRDPATGLLHHGWDESKKERWADSRTGTSSQIWGRAMGWYAMALVDVLEWLPRDHRERHAVEGVLRRLAQAIASVQDPATGVWWQVLDAGGREKNYREASASAMFVYALTKGVRQGWLDAKTFAPVAARGYLGTVEQFVGFGDDGQFQLQGVCKVAGLGGNPYRDGSYDYYTSTEVVTNDPKGVGAFLVASAERE
jgi:rhamnogalacturonyl hydrolase YesR